MSPSPVPLQDPVREYHALQDELDAAVARVAAAGRYILGPEVERFEEVVAGYLGVPHAVGVASGTDALLLALRALGVGPGDEVVTSPFTFFATAGAIVHAGARPVFADIRPDTFDLDPEAAAAAVSPRTAALLPVHLFGQMADMPAFRRLAERKGLALVEDTAQALGARQRPGTAERPAGRDAEKSGPPDVRDEPEGDLRAGACSDAGCVSFYPTKNLGAWGDGGLVTTSDDDVASRLRRLRVHGRPGDEYRHVEVGYNSRLDALQAAVLGVKLPHLDAWNERRREHAALYDEALADVEELRAPVVAPGNRHVYHQYTIRCAGRNGTIADLDERGIGHGVYYPIPLHLQEPFAALGYREGDFPEAERACREVLSLPVHQWLTEAEVGRVREALAGC